MKKLAKIIDVGISKYILNSNNNHIYINFESEFKIYENDKIIFSENNNYKPSFYIDGKIWILDITNKVTLIFNDEFEEIQKLNFLTVTSRNVDNFKFLKYIFPIIYSNDGEKKLIKFDNENLILLENYLLPLGLGVPYLIISEDKYISKNNLEFSLFNFENKVLWNINFKEIHKDESANLYSEILEINNKLFFIISGQEKGHFLYCVDIETGTILYKYEGLFGFLTKDDKYIYSQKFENILCKINTETGELEQWNVNDLLIENGFESIADHRTTALNEIVYFTQTIGDNKAKFGLLDTKKKQLIFKYNFEPKNGGIGKIEVNATRVYIHTQDNTLHIFEKQINNQ